MALVRRTVGRAQVPGASPVPHQVGVASVPGSVQPGLEMAAAVPSMPAKPWAVVCGLGIAAVGALGAWNVNVMAAPSTFRMDSAPAIFAALFVFAAAVERLLEPFSRWMPGRAEQERYEKALADVDNGVTGAMNAAAHYKAAVDQARASRGILMWGIATFLATVLSAGGGFYLLRLLSENPGWSGVPVWMDALITGLVVGSGTKPLHDMINRVQDRSSAQ